jgi:hypothetical protein
VVGANANQQLRRFSVHAKKLIELRKQAEKSVTDMPEGELKLKAFEVILTHLLSSGKADVATPPASGAKAKAEAAEVADMEAKSTAGRILVLKNEGFFKSPKSIGQVREELQAHGWHYPVATLSGELMGLVQKRKLRRQRGKLGNKSVWLYTNP